MARPNDTELHMLNLANQLDAIQPAARAMLAALKEVRANASQYHRGQLWQVAHDAIAAAEAAGIEL